MSTIPMKPYAFDDPVVASIFTDPTDIMPKMDGFEQNAYLSAASAIDRKQNALKRPARLSDFTDRDREKIYKATAILKKYRLPG